MNDMLGGCGSVCGWAVCVCMYVSWCIVVVVYVLSVYLVDVGCEVTSMCFICISVWFSAAVVCA